MLKLTSALKSGDRIRAADARLIVSGVKQLIATVQYDLVGSYTGKPVGESYAYPTMKADLNRLFKAAKLRQLQ